MWHTGRKETDKQWHHTAIAINLSIDSCQIWYIQLQLTKSTVIFGAIPIHWYTTKSIWFFIGQGRFTIKRTFCAIWSAWTCALDQRHIADKHSKLNWINSERASVQVLNINKLEIQVNCNEDDGNKSAWIVCVLLMLVSPQTALAGQLVQLIGMLSEWSANRWSHSEPQNGAAFIAKTFCASVQIAQRFKR